MISVSDIIGERAGRTPGRSGVRAGLFLTLLLTPAVCAAQDVGMMEMRSILTTVSPTGDELPNDAATLHKIQMFGRCLSQNQTDILSEPPESDRDRRSIFGMSMTPEHCSRYGINPQNAPYFLRGVYAEYALRRDFDLSKGTSRGHREKVFALPTDAKRARLTIPQKATLSFVEYATCVAKSDMPGVVRVIAAEPGTDPEKQAFGGLVPAMSQCLSPGLTLKVNRFKLRGYLAEGAYRQLSSQVTK
jgi:hypothetical protein